MFCSYVIHLNTGYALNVIVCFQMKTQVIHDNEESLLKDGSLSSKSTKGGVPFYLSYQEFCLLSQKHCTETYVYLAISSLSQNGG